MSLSVGIVGLPNVGKSTLFNALLKKQQALAANYPFATIEPNVGIVPVPDQRLQKLAETVAASRIHKDGMAGKEALTYTTLPPLVPATVKFLDIAGLVAGAHKGEGLGNQFLSHIRETDLILFVVRAFVDPDVVETGSQQVGEDLRTVQLELMMADLQTLDKQREPRANATPEEKKKWEVIGKLKSILNQERLVSEVEWTEEEWDHIRPLTLLTAKPALYAVNVSESDLVNGGDNLRTDFASKLAVEPEMVVVISAKVEADLADLDPLEQKEYLESLGLNESSLERLIQRAYRRLGLISFLTAGEKEVRAWTILKGFTAVQAAGVIHTDFMKHFIKADVVPFQSFVEKGGWKQAREVGAVRSEGRDYVVKDGDVVEFKVNA